MATAPRRPAERRRQRQRDGCREGRSRRSQPAQQRRQLCRWLAEGDGVADTLLAQITDAVLIVRADGRIVDANPVAARLFGYSLEQLLEGGVSLLMPSLDRRALRELTAGTATGGAAKGAPPRDLVGMTRSGEPVRLQARAAALPVTGRRRLVLLTLRDVSKRVALDNALRESERRFRAVFNENCQFTVLLDSNGGILEANVAALAWGGVQAAEVAGVPLWQAACWPASPAGREMVQTAIERVAEDAPVRYTDRVVWQDGSQRTIDVSVTAIGGADDDAGMLVVDGRDITDLVAAYEALRRSEARLADAQRIGQIGNWEWDLETGELLWSDEVYRIFELPYERFGASYEAFLERVHADDRGVVERAVSAALEDGASYAIDHRILRPDGQERIVHEQAEVHRDETGRALVMAGTVQDVTERKEREKALALAKEEAEAASRAKSQFLATMSHELRTPLNAIIGFAQILNDEVFGPLGNARYKDYTRDIHDSGQQLLSIVNDILDVAKVEAGAVTLHETVVDVSAVLEACLHLKQARGAEAGVALRCELAAEPPPLLGDERLLKQMLVNLLSNAIKFTPAGGVVTVGADKRANGELEMWVSDTGVGIAEQHLETVFEPFVQAEGPLKRRYAGTGLGLPLVKSFAELHGGRIELRSRLDAGTTVKVTFPAQRVVDDRPCKRA